MRCIAKFAIASLLLALPVSSDAAWELGLESVAPTGDFENFAGGGGGLYVNIYREANENLYQNLYVGALAYGGISIPETDFNYAGEIQWYGYPITVGGTYYLNGIESGGAFVKANAGALIKLGTVESMGIEQDESETGTVLSVGGGFDFGAVNIAADYNFGSDDWTWFAIKAAYRFGRN